MTIGIVLLVPLILLLFGDLSIWPHSRLRKLLPGQQRGFAACASEALLSADVFQGPTALQTEGSI